MSFERDALPTSTFSPEPWTLPALRAPDCSKPKTAWSRKAGNSVCIWLPLMPHLHPFFPEGSDLLYSSHQILLLHPFFPEGSDLLYSSHQIPCYLDAGQDLRHDHILPTVS